MMVTLNMATPEVSEMMVPDGILKTLNIDKNQNWLHCISVMWAERLKMGILLLRNVGIGQKTISNYVNHLVHSILPVPSVFIVDTSGKILFEYINPDYKTRLSALLAVLNELKNDKK